MSENKMSEKFVKFVIYLIVITLINIAGITLFFRIDLTKNKIYSISDASKKVVSTLNEPLSVNVFFTKNLPAPYNSIELYLHDLLEEYSINANKHFNYRFYDVNPIGDSESENRQLANNYGIYPVQIRLIENDEIKFKQAYMGLVLIHGDIIEKIPTITSTDGLEYELTTTISKLNNKISALLSLDKKISVKMFLSSSFEKVAPFIGLKDISDLPKQIEDVVEKVNEKNYGKLDFEYIDPPDENIKNIIKKYNITNLKWPDLGEGKASAGSGVIGLAIEYKDKFASVPLLNIFRIPIIGTQYQLVEMKDLEETINGTIESFMDINENLGYLADHSVLAISTTSANPMMRQNNESSNLKTLVSQNYTIKSVRLKDELIPDSLKCFVIAGPKEEFTDYELYQIDQALMRGTNLALFIDAFNETNPPNQQQYGYNQGPIYLPIKTGIEKLLEHYGVHIKKSYVLDENCYKQRMSSMAGGGERNIYFAPIIKGDFINAKLDFMKNIKGLITLKISPLKLKTDVIAENKLKAHQLIASSDRSWEMSERINLNPMFISPPQSSDEFQSNALAYIIEGNFPSYFDGKPIPEKTIKEKSKDADSENDDVKETDIKESDSKEIDTSKIEGQERFLSKAKSSKIFVMASSEVLKDNMLDAEGKSPNATFLMNILDYLNDKSDIAVMRSKEQRFNPLRETDAVTKTFIKFINVLMLPVLVVLFGFFVWLKRRSKRKHIKMIFTEMQ